jgi:hypothetical protein
MRGKKMGVRCVVGEKEREIGKGWWATCVVVKNGDRKKEKKKLGEGIIFYNICK